MKENTLYLECYSGISGDMTVAALLDLGADQKVLLDGLYSLHVDGYRIEIGRTTKNSIDACDFNVILDYDESHNHDSETNGSHHHGLDHNHDHAHSHNTEHSYNHTHSHDVEHVHDHTHDIDHSHDHIHIRSHQKILKPVQILGAARNLAPHLVLGHHEHRNYNQICDIIDQSKITAKAKSLAKKIFYIIAVAEAKAHSKPVDEVHFHEVGAIDSIVDIVAAAICLDNLNIGKVIVSELYEGTGQIKCQHGLLPIPVPAVSNIAAEHQLSLHITSVTGELVTPTGAAIVAAVKTSDKLPKEMKINKIGLGAGKRNYPGSSGILRAMLIEDANSYYGDTLTDQVWVLEANIDDCSGEALAYAMELLLQSGAKDVYYSPIYMKKNRPAYLLGVICNDDTMNDMERIIFTHTTTIGIRKTRSERTILQREIKTFSTSYGDVKAKICSYQNQTFVYPEYESVKVLCQTTNQDFSAMYQLICNIAKDQLS